MITFIWLAAVVVLAIGATLFYKANGSKERTIERQANASTQNATVGRATGRADN